MGIIPGFTGILPKVYILKYLQSKGILVLTGSIAVNQLLIILQQYQNHLLQQIYKTTKAQNVQLIGVIDWTDCRYTKEIGNIFRYCN